LKLDTLVMILRKFGFHWFSTLPVNILVYWPGLINVMFSSRFCPNSFLAHLTRRVMWAIAITWRPSLSFDVNFFKNLLLWKY
jgi:hypothetical protein